MIGSVKTALANIIGAMPTLKKANGAGRVFELFVMTGVAKRLKFLGFDVWLQRSDGTRIAPSDTNKRFIQRGGGPSGVAIATHGANNPSVIGFRRTPSGSEWEIWNGIQFKGRSGASHEIDVAIVPRIVGMQLRLTGGRPFGRPRVAIECKDVGQTGSMDEMRTFIARLYDLTILKGHQKYTPAPAPAQCIYPGILGGQAFYQAKLTYREENHHTLNVVARRTGFAAGLKPLCIYYEIKPHGNIFAASAAASKLTDCVAQWINNTCP